MLSNCGSVILVAILLSNHFVVCHGIGAIQAEEREADDSSPSSDALSLSQTDDSSSSPDAWDDLCGNTDDNDSPTKFWKRNSLKRAVLGNDGDDSGLYDGLLCSAWKAWKIGKHINCQIYLDWFRKTVAGGLYSMDDADAVCEVKIQWKPKSTLLGLIDRLSTQRSACSSSCPEQSKCVKRNDPCSKQNKSLYCLVNSFKQSWASISVSTCERTKQTVHATAPRVGVDTGKTEITEAEQEKNLYTTAASVGYPTPPSVIFY